MKIPGICLAALLIVAGCSTSERSTRQTEPVRAAVAVVTDEPISPPRRTPVNGEQARPDQETPRQVQAGGSLSFTYQTESSSITIPLDPTTMEFVVNMSGRPKVGDDVPRWDDEAMMKQRVEEIRLTLKYFVEAQELLFQQRYSEAMQTINRSLQITETAHALALKGTIFFLTGNSNQARAHWSRAVTIDPDIPLPTNMPELERLILQDREDIR